MLFVHICNLRTWEMEEEDQKFQVMVYSHSADSPCPCPPSGPGLLEGAVRKAEQTLWCDLNRKLRAIALSSHPGAGNEGHPSSTWPPLSMYVHMCLCVWRPHVSIGCLPQSLQPYILQGVGLYTCIRYSIPYILQRWTYNS